MDTRTDPAAPHIFLCRETWPALVSGEPEYNEQAAATRARIAAAAEREAREAGRPVVHILAPCGATLDVFPVRLPVAIDGAPRASGRVMPGVAEGSWLEFPSTSVPFAPGDGHGWRAARVLSRKAATARVEWWNRMGVRHECTVSLSRCRATYARTAPTPESARKKLSRERADRRRFDGR